MKHILFLAWLVLFAGLPAMAGQTLTPVAERPQAPRFSLPDLDGERVDWKRFEGRPVIVNFWATWCPPCRAELPAMNRAWRILEKEGVAMVAINVGEDADTVFTFTGDYPIDFPVLLDEEGVVVKEWGVRALPTTYVVDGAGHIVYRAVGGREWDDPELLERIRALGEERNP